MVIVALGALVGCAPETASTYCGSEAWAAELQLSYDGSPTYVRDPLRHAPDTCFLAGGPPYEVTLYTRPSGDAPAYPGEPETRDSVCRFTFDAAGALVPGGSCTYVFRDHRMYRFALGAGSIVVSGAHLAADVQGTLVGWTGSDMQSGSFTMHLEGDRASTPFDTSLLSPELVPLLPDGCRPAGCWRGSLTGRTESSAEGAEVGLDRYADPALEWGFSEDSTWLRFPWFVRDGEVLGEATPTLVPSVVLTDECTVVARAGQFGRDEYDLRWAISGDEATVTIEQTEGIGTIYRSYSGRLSRVECE